MEYIGKCLLTDYVIVAGIQVFELRYFEYTIWQGDERIMGYV